MEANALYIYDTRDGTVSCQIFPFAYQIKKFFVKEDAIPRDVGDDVNNQQHQQHQQQLVQAAVHQVTRPPKARISRKGKERAVDVQDDEFVSIPMETFVIHDYAESSNNKQAGPSSSR